MAEGGGIPNANPAGKQALLALLLTVPAICKTDQVFPLQPRLQEGVSATWDRQEYSQLWAAHFWVSMGQSSEAQPGSMQREAAYRARRGVQQEAKLAEVQVPCLLSAAVVYLNVLNGQYLNFHKYEFPTHLLPHRKKRK